MKSPNRTTSLIHKLTDNRCLVEYLSSCEQHDTTTTTIEALAVSVDPKDCSRIVKALGQFFPLPPSLCHLKRVKKTTKPEDQKQHQQMIHSNDEASDHRSNKRFKHNCDDDPKRPSLQILVGLNPIASILQSYQSLNSSNKDDKEESDLQLAGETLVKILLGNLRNDGNPHEVLKELLHPVKIPTKPPQSQVQADAANQLWPTHFFPLKSMEYRHQQLALLPDELSQMLDMMEMVLGHNAPVAIVVDPSTFTVVATSWDEQELQVGSTNNPLSTPILWAIQGVSRLERKQHDDDTKTTTTTTTTHHYLCTNFDLYCNYEPTIFEAMASVHSRFGRVIFSRQQDSKREQEGVVVWRKALSRHAIHCLPGTNHHFRAFEYTLCDV